MIRASRIFIAVIALIALGTRSAAAHSWGRPVTVSYDGVPDRLDDFGGFVASPDGKHVALVTLREHKGIVIYPLKRNGRLGRGSYLPGSKNADYPWEMHQAEQAAHGQYPDAAMNDKGIVAVAWQTLKGSEDIGPGGGICNCTIRVDVGTPGAHFSSIVLAPRGDAVLGVQIAPSGHLQVLWEAGERHLVVANAHKPWRSAIERAIPPAAAPGSAEDTFLIEREGQPEILSESKEAILLARNPFMAATPIDLAWPAGETAGSWSLLSGGNGLTMAAIANVQRNSLEVATPVGAAPTFTFHPVSPLVAGPGTHPSRCSLAGVANARGEALVAWTCYSGEPAPEVLRAALLDPEGAVSALSPAESGWFGQSGPAVALDDGGHGVVAEERDYEQYASIFLGSGRFSQWQSIRHGPNDAQSTVAVGVTSSGVALATWVEEPSETESSATWAGRIRLDRSEPESSPTVPPVLSQADSLQPGRTGMLTAVLGPNPTISEARRR